MRKINFFSALLFSLVSFNAVAQNEVPVVTVGTIMPNTYTNGKTEPVFATSDRISRSERLVVNTPNCEVTSYTFTITAGDRHTGPIAVNGAKLTDAIIAKVKETKGPGVKVSFNDIHLNHNGKDVVANPVVLKYDQ